MVLATPGALEPAGPVADAVAALWWLMLALGVGVFAVFAGLLVRSLVTGPRSGRGTDDDGLVRRWVVLAGVALPTVVITVVFGATLVAMRQTPRAAASETLTVEIVGHQFWYEIRYPDHDVVTANELHVPVGRPVAFELTSDDVIHSFWVPALGGKMDMMPDGTNTLVLEADEPGEHRSRCAEFCGLQHTRMGLVVVAEDEDRFHRWVERQQRPAVEPVEGAATRGQEVFLGAGCAACHAVRGMPGTAPGGPDLTHLASRRTLAAATVPNEPDHLRAWIEDPQSVKTGVDMPAADLTEDELDDLVTYLQGLR